MRTQTARRRPAHGLKTLGTLPVVGPVLGLLTAGMLIFRATMAEAEALTGSGSLSILVGLVPPLVLALLVGNPDRGQPNRAGLQAMSPVAFGLVTATLLLQFPLPDATGLLVAGAVLSALPFFAAAVLARPGLAQPDVRFRPEHPTVF